MGACWCCDLLDQFEMHWCGARSLFKTDSFKWFDSFEEFVQLIRGEIFDSFLSITQELPKFSAQLFIIIIEHNKYIKFIMSIKTPTTTVKTAKNT